MALRRITLENGQILDQETHALVQIMSTIVGINLFDYITNGSYSTRVAASGDTHSGAGAFDLSGSRLGKEKIDLCVSVWRRIAAGRGTGWRRDPNGTWPLHGHFVLVTSETAPSAVAQFKAYLRGEDGLKGDGRDNGPRDWATADATATPDYNMAYASTGVSSNPVETVAGSAMTIQSLYAALTNPDTLKRILLFVIGLVLVITALIRITANSLPIDIDVSALTKKVGK